MEELGVIFGGHYIGAALIILGCFNRTFLVIP